MDVFFSLTSATPLYYLGRVKGYSAVYYIVWPILRNIQYPLQRRKSLRILNIYQCTKPFYLRTKSLSKRLKLGMAEAGDTLPISGKSCQKIAGFVN